ncbi:MMPL family transporter [Agromyces albus]|uniref:MMPL family transporter n=1 Tax=Agromyces albus TaxID=205332 RepID=A0A4Q2L5R4_9MICO|nr:MMPL family transporter [Agromyces albus]
MIGRSVSRFPKSVVAASVAVFIVFAALAVTAIESLSLNRYDAPGSESVAARELLAERFKTSSPNIAVLVEAKQGDVDDADVAVAGAGLTEQIAAFDGVGDAWSYWSPDGPASLASNDRDSALILAWAAGDADHVRGELLPELEAEVIAGADDAAIAVHLGGSDEVFRAVAEQARTDFLRAELIILPLVIGLLWLVYRRLSAALVTMAVGLFSVAGSLAILRIVSEFTDISTFASNIALVMGIGLGVDYGLFMTYRFREELAAGREVADAVRAAVRAAGRTIVFSGATVAAALAVLFVFPFPFLSSFAYAGIAVVVTAVIGSTVLLPAALRLLGHRVARPERTTSAGTAAAAPEQGFWYRTATRVMRRPALAGGLGLVVLLALGAPALATNFGPPDDRILRATQPVRAMYDTIRSDFAAEDADSVYIVTESATDAAIAEYAESASLLGGIQRVDAATGAYVDGERIGDPGPFGVDRFRDGDAAWISVLPTTERLAADPIDLVSDIRALDAPFDAIVGGYPAELADYRAGVLERFPLVAGLILLVTFVMLFIMTGSVVAPLKASILNLLSLSVMFGVLVWGFQEGGLSGILGFAPTGTIEPSIPLLMFCIAYGLSMDYEVFLLARIKEDYDRTGDVVASVSRGIARSAPLVSAAALILAISFAVYATSEVTFLQQLGIGMALAIVVDATIIRGVLVPAFMRLAGRANWWAPPFLRRFHDRFGWRDEPEHAGTPAPARATAEAMG